MGSSLWYQFKRITNQGPPVTPPRKPDRPPSTVLARFALADARRSMINLQSEVSASSDYWEVVEAVIEAIDSVAELETGDRGHFSDESE